MPCTWRNYSALRGYFQRASVDLTRSSSERAKFAGLAKKLATVSFLNDFAIVKDILRELSCLSLKLQSRTCNLVTYYAEVDETMAILTAFKIAGGGKSTNKVFAIGTTNTSKGVLLTDGKPSINQFMTAILIPHPYMYGLGLLREIDCQHRGKQAPSSVLQTLARWTIIKSSYRKMCVTRDCQYCCRSFILVLL